MKNCFCLGVVLLVASARFAAADPILGVAFDGGLYNINSSTGSGALVGSTGVTGLGSLAQNSAGTLYAAGQDGLRTLNPSTGDASSVVPITGLLEGQSIRGLAFSATDVLYAINNGGGVGPVGIDDPLYTINTATGAATFVGLTGFGNVQALDFSPTGVLYGWDSFFSGLIIINPLTGAAVDVNPTVGASVDIQSIVFGPSHALRRPGFVVHDRCAYRRAHARRIWRVQQRPRSRIRFADRCS